MPQKDQYYQGLLLAFLGAMCLTPDALLVRLANSSDWNILFWRGLYIALCLAILQLVQTKRIIWRNYIPLLKKEWVCAILSALAILFFVLSVSHTSVANTLVILSIMPFFAALISLFLLKEKIPLYTWVAIGFAFIGILVVFIDTLDNTGNLGKIFALLCALTSALNMTLIRSDEKLNLGAIFIWGGLIVAAFSFLSQQDTTFDSENTLVLFLMGAMNALAFMFLGAGAKRIPSPEVGLMMLLETIIGPIWVWFVLQESPNVNALIGGAIVILTLSLHSLYAMKKGLQ